MGNQLERDDDETRGRKAKAEDKLRGLHENPTGEIGDSGVSGGSGAPLSLSRYVAVVA